MKEESRNRFYQNRDLWFYAVAASCAIGGMSFILADKPKLASWTLFSIAAAFAIFPKLLRLFKNRRIVIVFSANGEGKSYILDRIREASLTGGIVFSTYLLERAKGSDNIYDILRMAQNENQSQEILEYNRLVMIDDPTQEEKWITEFLSLSGPSRNSGIIPRVFAVRCPSRPVGRLLQSILLRVSLTLIDQGQGNKTVYISLSEIVSLRGRCINTPFAFAIKNNKIHEMLNRYIFEVIESNRDLIRTLYSPQDYAQATLRPHLDFLGARLLNAIEEYAFSDINVKHVGVFGSFASVYGTIIGSGSNDKLRWKPESDLDLIVVVAEGADREAVKSQIETVFLDQVDKSVGESVEIEWSNERATFYCFRHGYHVDIQLHNVGDEYYISRTSLLGYSIFGSSYLVVYADQGLPVDRFIRIPRKPLNRRKRARLMLDDELGLRTFISHCKKGDIRIDPRRVIAINIKNLVWVISGMHSPTVEESLEFLMASDSLNDINIPNENLEVLWSEVQRIISSDISDDREEELRGLMKKTIYVINKFEDIVMELC